MSREEIKNVLIRLTKDGYWTNTTGFEYALGQANDEIERLLTQEREKVRERCVFAACQACKEGLPLEKDTNGNEFHVFQVGEDEFEQTHCYSEAIRQLDLTKPESDLAASSREEGEQ